MPRRLLFLGSDDSLGRGLLPIAVAGGDEQTIEHPSGELRISRSEDATVHDSPAAEFVTADHEGSGRKEVSARKRR